MNRSRKGGRRKGQQSPYKIITESAYKDRHVFKSVCFMTAVGLSLTAVISTVPQTAANLVKVSLEDVNAPSYTQYTDASIFYTDDNLVNFSVPELDELSELIEELVAADEVSQRKKEGDTAFSKCVTTMSDEEAQEKLENIEAKKATARTIITASGTFENYTCLNKRGIPMSQKGTVEVDENGVPLHYSKMIKGTATAYCTGTITSRGTRPIQGTVAVDPREIPYGTKMYITSADGSYVYGLAVAEDTGGFIYWPRGATVDLYMYSKSDCTTWGFRGVNIYILD
ncbi:MAG: 3D domain-containing protein [Oscillospiraceae bacterium]|nr:3D domain-containing protein [Oscillospiraceae bacterium]